MMVLVGSICIPFSLLETVVRYFILGTTAYLLLSQYIHTFYICNGAELGGATGAMAPLVFWSRSLKKSRKSRNQSLVSLEWHQLFLPLFGANVYLYVRHKKYQNSKQ